MKKLVRVTWIEKHEAEVWADDVREAEELAQSEFNTLDEITEIDSEIIEERHEYDGPDTNDEAKGLC